jgi:hypothetical protein
MSTETVSTITVPAPEGTNDVPAKRVPKTPQGPRYRALKRIVVGNKVYKPGQLVPEAKTWTRVEAWVRSRHLELVE